MVKKRALFKLITALSVLIVFSSSICISGCSYIRHQSDTIDDYVSGEITYEEAVDELIDESEDLVDAIVENVDDFLSIDSESFVPFDPDNSFSYCDQPVCKYNKDSQEIEFTIHFNKIPASDDYYIYLFDMATYEDDESFACKRYVASAPKDNTVIFHFAYEDKFLFSRFVPVVAYDKSFHPLSLGQFISNPEDISDHDTPYPEVDSKKGILLDPLTIDKPELESLNVKRVVYNLPLSFIMGETDNESCPTVDYEYLGKTYQFNGYMLEGFDNLFAYLSKNNYHVTAVILNDWNEKYPEIMHPLSRVKTGRSLYYAFNTEEEDGVRLMEAAATFLAKRYSGGEYGLIHDWVIANEVNQHKMWNYMNIDDLTLYATSFEKSFRTFYNAIKSNNNNARVYYSLDHDWNSNGGRNYLRFNGKDFLNTFNEIAKSRGDYDWSLSIHPYPQPLTNTRFWYGNYDKTEDTRQITPMNLTALTDYMQKDEFLDTNGNVRQIAVTELGFSSYAGESAQAAAFAYCYYIINDNEFINSFLMNRQTDSYLSLQSGLALGIYNPDYSSKPIGDVFAQIDTDEGEEYIPKMLEIIGAGSLEEALDRAR